VQYCSFIQMIGTGGYLTLGLELDDEDDLTASKTKSTPHELHHFIAGKNYDRIVTRIHLQGYNSTITSIQNDAKDQTRKRGGRLMLVDDDQDISFLFKIVLAGEGYIVDSFNNPFEALQRFENGLYDLIIIDIVMPKMNGFMLYEKIRKLDEKVKVCFLTAADMTYYEEIKKDAFPELDATNCFIRKPIENEELIRQVREIMNSVED
jgi:CheY-like chemotaxis protein